MVSIVIPTFNSERTVERCLLSVTQQLAERDEVLVVDNHSSDQTVQIVERFGNVRLIEHGPERTAQRNRGAGEAKCPFVFFVDSDMVLEPGLLSEIRDLEVSNAVDAAIVPEASFGTGFWGKVRILDKALARGNPDLEAARVFRLKIFDELGGWNETMVSAEDWELHDRLVTAHGYVIRTENWIWHDEGKPTYSAILRKRRYYAPDAWSYVQTSNRKVAGTLRRYTTQYARPQLGKQPLTTLGLFFLRASEALLMPYWLKTSRRTAAQVYRNS